MELKAAVTSLTWTVDGAKRSGLLALGDEADRAVGRREELQAFLVSFYDGVRAVDAVASYYDEQPGEEAFLLNYIGELAIYLNLAMVMDATAGRPHYETILSEARPELGLRKGMYSELKNAFNLQPWNKPLGLVHLRHQGLSDEYAELGLDKKHGWALSYIEAHEQELVARGITTGPQVFAKDVLQRVTDGFHWVWFPAQKEVAEGLGDTRVVSADRRLISDEKIVRATTLMRPGDVIVERRNWYLSNIGLPGFWPHSALYVGSLDQVRVEFGAEFVEGLEAAYPAAVAAWKEREDGHVRRILEAVSEGVVFSSTEHSLGADFVAAMRPELDRQQRGAMLRAAFGYFGRPYDFDFDFRTDDTIVCSELVYKAYESATPEGSSRITVGTILGRPVLSPNDLVAYYAAHHRDEAPPFHFVFFLDGVEGERRAHFRDEAVFVESYMRPKWDIAQP